MTRNFCDKCEELIKNQTYRVTLWNDIKVSLVSGGEYPMDRHLDLCEECFVGLKQYLKRK